MRGNRAMRLFDLYQFSQQFIVGLLSLVNEKDSAEKPCCIFEFNEKRIIVAKFRISL